MANSKPRQTFDAEAEYKAIERTLLGSARGRWFLSEHGRRARRLDSLTLHDAIAKLQDSLREPPALLGQLRREIEGLQELLRETREALLAKRASVATGTAGAGPTKGAELSGAAHILSVAEQIHAMAWDLQAQDINPAACEGIARQAAQIYALSHRQAVESERIQSLTEALDAALMRLDGLLETVAHEDQFDTYNEPFDDVASFDAGADPLPDVS